MFYIIVYIQGVYNTSVTTTNTYTNKRTHITNNRSDSLSLSIYIYIYICICARIRFAFIAKICRPGLAPALPRLPPATPRDATTAGASSLISTSFAMRRTLRRLLASFSNAEIQSGTGVQRGGSTRHSGSGSRDEGQEPKT